jgi:hypothetical protein
MHREIWLETATEGATRYVSVETTIILKIEFKLYIYTYEGTDWICTGPDRVKRRYFVNMIMNFRIL